MISAEIEYLYMDPDPRPRSAEWLMNDVVVLWQRDGKVSVRGIGNAARVRLDTSNALILGMCRSDVTRSISFITSQAVEVYRPGKRLPTVVAYHAPTPFQTALGCFADDGGHLITVDENSQLYAYTAATGWRKLGQLRLRSATCGCQIGDDTYAFGSGVGEIEVVSLNPFHSRSLRRVHSDSVQDLSRMANMSFISASRDRSIAAWHVDDTKLDEIWSLPDVHAHFINCVTLVGEHLWTGGSDGVIKRFSIRDRALNLELSLHSDAIRKIAVAPDSQKLITVSDDGTCQILDEPNGMPLTKLGKRRSYISCADVRFQDGSVRALLGKTNGAVTLVDPDSALDSPQQIRMLGTRVRSIRMISDGGWFCGLEDGRLVYIDRTGIRNEIVSFAPDAIYSAMVDESAGRLWTGRRSGKVDLWSTMPLQHILTEKIHESIVGDILNIGGNQVLTCSDDQSLKVINGLLLRSIQMTSLGSSALNNILQADNLLLVSSDDGRVFVLEPVTHAVLADYTEHRSPVRALCRVAHGFVCSGDRDGWLRVWHPRTLATVWTRRLNSRVIALAFDPGTNMLIAITESEVANIGLSLEEHDVELRGSDVRPDRASRKGPIVLICALQKESDALLARLSNQSALIQRQSPDGAIVLESSEPGQPTAVIDVVGTSGNAKSRQLAERLVETFQPRLVILFGIAAGVRERVSIGDTVISSTVWDLRKSKVAGTEFEFEPREMPTPQPQRIPFKVRDLENTTRQIARDGVRIHIDLLCGSSDNLIRSRSFMETAAATHRKLGALEMEAAGVAEVCMSHAVPFFVVKSISDYGDDQKSDSSHDLCCDIAAAVVMEGWIAAHRRTF